jgi:hypothetical protein
MDKKYFGIFAKTAAAGCIFLIINVLLYQLPGLKGQDTGFVYPVPVLYIFFFFFSIAILAVLIITNTKNQGQLGYIFLLLTSIKMVASYFLAKPILSKTIEFPTEKANFLAVFVLFLAIEAYFTARLLNNKQ